MPTAMRRWCGSGDSPGSEICRSAMSAVHRFVDFLVELLEEAQLAHERAAGVVVGRIEGAPKQLQHLAARSGDLRAQPGERLDIAFGARLGRRLAPFHLLHEEV